MASFKLVKIHYLIVPVLVVFGSFLFSGSIYAQEAEDVEITVHQELYSVRPTLDVDELSRYSNNGWLQNSFVSFGIPLLLFGIALVVGRLVFFRKKRLQCTKEDCKRTNIRILFGGAMNAIAFFVIIEIIRSVASPAQLPSLAIYVDDSSVFGQGDVLQMEFDIRNSGSSTATNLQFRNSLSEEVRIDAESVLFEKDGTLPEESIPYITRDQIVIMIGSLKPGESVQLSYEVLILTNKETNIFNTASVIGDGIDLTSNEIIINREHGSKDTFNLSTLERVQSVLTGATYLLDFDQHLRQYVNDESMNSWFLNKKNVKAEEPIIQSYREGKTLLPRPGTWLIQSTETEDIYYIDLGMELRPIDEVALMQFFGESWFTDTVSISESILSTYEIGQDITLNTIPDGMYVTDGDARCLVIHSRCMPVTESGIMENGLQDRFLRIVDTELIDQLPTGDLLDHYSMELFRTYLDS